MRELKGRLYTIKTLIPDGVRVADIGTDHGHLPISLIKSGNVSGVIATDIREKPLASARQNIEKTGTVGIELRLGDGLSPILPHEVDYIVISGMGGEVISSILSDCDWIKDKKFTLLLQPMTSADALRRYLTENGFEIIEETALSDSNKLYTVIKAAYSGEKIKKSEAFYRLGKIKADTECGRAYIDKQLGIVKKCIADLQKTEKQDEVAEFLQLLSDMEKMF